MQHTANERLNHMRHLFLRVLLATLACVVCGTSTQRGCAEDFKISPSNSDQVWYPNDQAVVMDGRYAALFQKDGNFVLYETAETPGNGTNRVVWSSDTQGKGSKLYLQADGNLVIYNNNMRPVWASNTQNHAGARLRIRDGLLEVFLGDQVLWVSKSALAARPQSGRPQPAGFVTLTDISDDPAKFKGKTFTTKMRIFSDDISPEKVTDLKGNTTLDGALLNARDSTRLSEQFGNSHLLISGQLNIVMKNKKMARAMKDRLSSIGMGFDFSSTVSVEQLTHEGSRYDVLIVHAVEVIHERDGPIESLTFNEDMFK
jgi:hypothetical protein